MVPRVELDRELVEGAGSVLGDTFEEPGGGSGAAKVGAPEDLMSS